MFLQPNGNDPSSYPELVILIVTTTFKIKKALKFLRVTGNPAE